MTERSTYWRIRLVMERCEPVGDGLAMAHVTNERTVAASHNKALVDERWKKACKATDAYVPQKRN
jgi:hypothetical protein